MKTDLFQSCARCWVSQICWHIECSTFTASSFGLWNSSTETVFWIINPFISMQYSSLSQEAEAFFLIPVAMGCCLFPTVVWDFYSVERRTGENLGKAAHLSRGGCPSSLQCVPAGFFPGLSPVFSVSALWGQWRRISLNSIMSMALRILYCLISPHSTTANQFIHNFNGIPLILDVQLHQSKGKKYSHPISAFNHLVFLRINFGWLASWLPSNLSSLINLWKVVNMQVQLLLL